MTSRPGKRSREVALGIAIGVLADRVFGDPSRLHPVAGMGQLAGALEKQLYRDTRGAGLGFALTCLTASAATGLALRRGGALAVGVAVWSTLGGTTLCKIGDRMADALEQGDIAAARALVPSLCGRDPAALDDAGICRATIESVAENTSDAAVGPLVAAAFAGAPGVLAYRMVNTLDAMVGYRTPRYERFGWASAKLDDAANLIPARLSGLLAAALSGSPGRALRTWRDDAHHHPSPNAGVVEAAFAGALGFSLGGTTIYPTHVEERPVLGAGAYPTVDDLRAAVALSRRVQYAAAALSVGVTLCRMVD
ncbi:adenosylcobinamide-phosphate synthase [Gordonia effusa NBRC 100432]|uniref:Cobalamin biosynthesis protein CobD n=1 Tax=Gordonia effusa NBRC 100432 TaxID=1077974 RepID=H0R2C2_9ACTN|nr:cobalamin biosynthesis protein [Gordonia effusa]GAB19223.1 adenosylcobinamide-phosphate synthase [Gordonia effusa NBRC 100432]